jgi:hypothetical protein
MQDCTSVTGSPGRNPESTQVRNEEDYLNSELMIGVTGMTLSVIQVTLSLYLEARHQRARPDTQKPREYKRKFSDRRQVKARKDD